MGNTSYREKAHPPSKQRERKSVLSPPAPLENFSAQRAAWLFVCQPDELDQTQQAGLAMVDLNQAMRPS